MPLTQQDLTAISGLISQQLAPIQADIHQIKVDIAILKIDVAAMKGDLNLLARLNQLDYIRKEPRLRALYSTTEDDQKEG